MFLFEVDFYQLKVALIAKPPYQIGLPHLPGSPDDQWLAVRTIEPCGEICFFVPFHGYIITLKLKKVRVKKSPW
jgi:hypothetical protein